VKAWGKYGDATMMQALYEWTPSDKWMDGRLTIFGDAAHAMFPHQEQDYRGRAYLSAGSECRKYGQTHGMLGSVAKRRNQYSGSIQVGTPDGSLVVAIPRNGGS
jgi:hypothetical protein